MSDNFGESDQFREVRIGVNGADDVIPDGFYRHADGTLSTEPESVSRPKLKDRIAAVGASLAAVTLNKVKSVGPSLVEVGAGLKEYGVSTTKALGAVISAPVKFFKAKPQTEAIVTESVEGDENISVKKPKLSLLDRARAVSASLKQHSEALSTMAVSVGIGVGAKLAIAAGAAAFGAASVPFIVPVAAAAVLGTSVSALMRGRKNWRAAQIEQNKENLYQQKLNEGGLLELKGETDDERRAEFFNTVSRAEYDDRADLGFFKNTLATLRDLTRREVRKSITARDIGYALGAGLTAGVSSALTHLAHDYITSPSTAAPKVDASATTESAPAPKAFVAAPAPAAPAPAVNFAAAPIAQKLEIVRSSIQGEPSDYMSNRLTAAASGNAQAMKDVARALYAGEHGVSTDQARAISLYEQAAEAGNKQAIRDLAYIRSLSGDSAPIETPQADQVPAGRSVPRAEVPTAPRASLITPDFLSDLPTETQPPVGNTDLLPVDAPLAPVALSPTTIIGYNVAGFDPNGDSMAQCFNISETCEVAQMQVAEGNELVRFQDGSVAVDAQMEKGETLNGFLARQFGRWNTIRGQLDMLKSRVSLGQPITPQDIGEGNIVTTASGQTLAGRASIESSIGSQFADATNSGGGSNSVDVAAANDNSGGAHAMPLASLGMK